MLQAVRKFFSPIEQREPYQPQWVGHLDIQFTPDVWKLEQYYLQNVFIYNELMQGCSKFERVMDGKVRQLSKAFTRDEMVLWKKKLGLETRAFALPVDEDQLIGNDDSYIGKPAKVEGQIFTMRPSQVIALDNYHLNGVEFQRKRITLEIPYRPLVLKHGKLVPGKQMTQIVRAWAYIGKPDYWTEQFDPKHERFDTCKLYTANEGKQDLRLQYYLYFEQYEQNRK